MKENFKILQVKDGQIFSRFRHLVDFLDLFSVIESKGKNREKIFFSIFFTGT